jgi:D-methionine transport system ATP-binding protein
MDTKEYTIRSKQLAIAIVNAYGKDPSLYDDLEEQVICAFTFGAHRAFSVASGVQEWESKILMLEILSDVFGFPMEIAGLRKKEARRQALEYLRTVELEDKASAYPVQLSGGQQQRVAIARALASHPRIILCDEATSALDPKTTRTILELLRKVNREYGISIVIITHEMRVITEICDRVAVLHHGVVAETGPVKEVFRNPKSTAAKRLLLLEESEQLEEEIEGEEGLYAVV